MTPRIVFAALCSLTLVACGGSVALHETGGQGSGGGSTGSSGDGGYGGSGGYAGEGGYGGIGGTGGGACSDTSDHFVFTLVGPDGNIDCTKAVQGTSQKAHVEGVVISSAANTLTVDTCPPGTACDGSQYTLAIDSPGFGAYVITGSFVQIDVAVDYPWGCTNTLMVRNLPTFGGQPSPAGGVPWLMFAGSDGSSAAPEGAPFTLTTTPLGCNPSGQSCGGPPADSYRFDFGGTEVVPVYEGDSQIVHITQNQVGSMMLFRNLRSYESGWCDDYWNYAYWITPAPIPD